jgi:hypothetical protein
MWPPQFQPERRYLPKPLPGQSESPDKPAGCRTPLLHHIRSAILDVLPGDPEFVKSVQEIDDLGIVKYVPHCDSKTSR